MTSLGESVGARRARHFCALERRLFELLGGWVPSVPEPEVKLLLRAHSFQHAWHASLWVGLLPVGEDEGSAVLRPQLAALLDRVAERAGTADRLAAAYGMLLPRLLTTYERVRHGLREASDGPLDRVLTLVLADDGRACQAGQSLLKGLAREPGENAAGASSLDGLDGEISTAGGLDINEVA